MYSDVLEDELKEAEDIEDMGSFNHGYLQARLVVLLDRLGSYTPVNELSLELGAIDLGAYDLRTTTEVRPDISLYPKRGLSRPTDILRMSEMPLLAVEILSPRQGTYEILEKFKVYFELGIKSCWLVDPAINTVTVYTSINQWRTFSSGELVDETLSIRLPMDDIFA
jgi:Uma2 family endonuclease